MYDNHITKANTKSNMKIIKIGGDAFKIGLEEVPHQVLKIIQKI